MKHLRGSSNKDRIQIRKLVERTKVLGKENESLRNNLKGACAEDNSRQIKLSCNFELIDNMYSCRAENLQIGKENSTIENISGAHVLSKRDNDIKSLVLINQATKFLPNGISMNFPNLENLSVQNSKLNIINRPPFENLNEVKSLDIRGNQVDSIDPESFDDMPKLVNVIMSNNNIQKLPPKLFEKLQLIRNIDLSNNKIKSLPFDVIPVTNVIESFIVNNNLVAKIDPRIFKRLTNVLTLDFENNNCVNEKINAGDENQKKNSLFGKMATDCLNQDYENEFCGPK